MLFSTALFAGRISSHENASLAASTGRRSFVLEALRDAAAEPVTPWMGQDTAKHYQWFPWHNNGHYETWRRASPPEKAKLAAYYKRGLQAVVGKAQNGFKIGIPFIWCSNNLMASFATQAYLYRRMTGDNQFREYEAAAIEQAYKLADSYNRQFLRVLRQLRDLRRYAPVIIQNNGGQVNVGNQQVNVQKTE